MPQALLRIKIARRSQWAKELLMGSFVAFYSLAPNYLYPPHAGSVEKLDRYITNSENEEFILPG